MNEHLGKSTTLYSKELQKLKYFSYVPFLNYVYYHNVGGILWKDKTL